MDTSPLFDYRVIQYHAFVSYRSDDAEVVQELTRLLQFNGMRIWWDRDDGQHDQAPRDGTDVRGTPIEGGKEEIQKALDHAINSSIFVLVITTPNTLKSSWVRTELQSARRLNRPLFFWHIPLEGETPGVSIRTSGTTPINMQDNVLDVSSYASGFDRVHAAPLTSVEFVSELADKKNLNLLGHNISPFSEIQAVCGDLVCLNELCELIIHNGDTVNIQMVYKHWPEYSRLRDEAESLRAEILEKYGKEIHVGRKPIAGYFRLKRPFIKTKVKHLHRLLDSEQFRQQEFGNLDSVR